MFLKRNLRRAKPGGFSLLELLLAASLVPLVSFVIFSNIASGMRLWKALNQAVGEEDVILFRQKLAGDLNRAFKFSEVPFTGEETRVSFAANVWSPEILGGDRGIGSITFFYDDAGKQIVKQETNLSELFKEKPGQSHTLLQHVSALQVQYFGYDPIRDEYVWRETWEASEKMLPVAVRFLCRLEGESEPRIFTFPIAVGG